MKQFQIRSKSILKLLIALAARAFALYIGSILYGIYAMS
jgi:hypothetical protein